LLAGRPWRGRVVSIGPVTSHTCRELGLEVAVEADRHDLDGLVKALVVAAGHLPGGAAQ
jgi:uroporphyrinogen-III synthase